MTYQNRNASKTIRKDVTMIIITVVIGLTVLILITALADSSISGAGPIGENLYGATKVSTRFFYGFLAMVFTVVLWAFCSFTHTSIKNELPKALLQRSLERSAHRHPAVTHSTDKIGQTHEN